MNDLEWVDGRAFAAWIEGRRPDVQRVLTESQQRTFYRLREERGRGSLDVADRLCVRLGLHINEIPEWIWTTKPGFGKRNNRRYSTEVRTEAVRMLRGGTSIKDVAIVLDLPRSTVKNWKAREVDGTK